MAPEGSGGQASLRPQEATLTTPHPSPLSVSPILLSAASSPPAPPQLSVGPVLSAFPASPYESPFSGEDLENLFTGA